MVEHIYVATTDSGLIDIVKIDSKAQWITTLELDYKPDWLVLENDMCEDCKYHYQGSTVKYCKAAIGLYAAVKSFSDIRSIERVGMTIITANSITSKCTQAHEGLSILFLSCLIFSGCYKFKQFTWAWDFYDSHPDDIGIFYSLFSSYITKKILLDHQGKSKLLRDNLLFEFKKIYYSLRCIIRRVEKASNEDANMNALVRLTNMTHMFQTDYEDYLNHFRELIASCTDTPHTPILP
ncbi:MAG: hypothetical protein V3573_08955 [Desulfovibrionaceae bacterium]